jgi:hypothetical protein
MIKPKFGPAILVLSPLVVPEASFAQSASPYQTSNSKAARSGIAATPLRKRAHHAGRLWRQHRRARPPERFAHGRCRDQRLAASKSEGRSLEAIVTAKPSGPYDAKWGTSLINPARFIALAYHGI